MSPGDLSPAGCALAANAVLFYTENGKGAQHEPAALGRAGRKAVWNVALPSAPVDEGWPWLRMESVWRP